MKIFLDSSDIEEIKQAYDWGVAEGITTNPSNFRLAIEKRKEKTDLEIYIRTILKTAKGTPVSLEVTETDGNKMYEQGRRLYKFFNHTAKNVCIKIPVNTATNDEEKQFEGLKAIRLLSKDKIPVNATLIFTPEQALMAAKAGAKYISPFAGRLDDLIREKNKIKFAKFDYFPAEGLKDAEIKEDNGIVSGIDLVKKCVEILKLHKINAEIIAASMRSPRHVREAALAGAHIATVPFPVIKDMLKHQKTYDGVKKFSEDAAAEPEYASLNLK
ncbi:MAG: transaldolase family protein [Candidatus Nanoarchaeia archaeon]